MQFDSLQYWSFFAAVLCLFLVTTGAVARALLVAASYAFYACWDVRFLALLAASTLANYLLGLLLERSAGGRRRIWLMAGVTINLGFLGFFKYYDFFAASLCALLGIDKASWVLGVVLPVGISFFTFEGIAYISDIYRREIGARRSLLDFALFVSFFPHLVAGPIIRPHDFFPQLERDFTPDRADLQWSIYQILKGLFKKVVLSDAVALHADHYFNGDGSVLPWVGVLAFTLRIYFDFSGYTDIARGCACLLGIRLPANFERPYLATNISLFWRRWHISLSSWLRDYLYIPLGGSRTGPLRVYLNYLIVMGLGGIWHGANWNFLFWGLWHGLLLCVHRLWTTRLAGHVPALLRGRAATALCWALTMLAVVIGWIPFRCETAAQTLRVLRELATPALNPLSGVPLPFALMLGGFAAFYALDRNAGLERRIQAGLSWWLYLPGAGLVLWSIDLLMTRAGDIPFIYFRF